jgi:hypothetical protein
MPAYLPSTPETTIFGVPIDALGQDSGVASYLTGGSSILAGAQAVGFDGVNWQKASQSLNSNNVANTASLGDKISEYFNDSDNTTTICIGAAALVLLVMAIKKR